VLHSLIALAVLMGSGVLWVAGLQLFLRSHLSRARKTNWSAFLLLVGIGIGLLLPSDQIWRRFLVVMVGLPILAVADVWLFRSGRDLSFWIRACGFEVCTVFGTAGGARYLCELAGVAALVRRTG
jgi:dolichyl-phosphate-mannose--protein O-mannosyl transferase